ncbi:MAG: hypothetical protein H5U02_00345 [Clostridia bacterium]|nr:hypothetical protein [Clostridia bacterium]
MPKDYFAEIGVTGLQRWGGLVYEEHLLDLGGPRAVKVYKQMRDDDPIIGAILFAIKMLCRQASWRVEPGGSKQADLEAADFLESCMYDMSQSWHDTVTEILSMLVFGWSYHEIVYKRREGASRDPTRKSKYNDGRIGWRKIPIRAQETLNAWIFDEDGGIQGMKQLAPPDYRLTDIPIEKALLFRTESSKNNPEGRSVLRNAYRPWYFKKNIEVIEAIGIERDLAGFPVVWVPEKIANPETEEERGSYEAFKRLVTGMKRDQQEGAVMPLVYDERGNKLYDLTLLSTGSRRQFDTTAIVQRYDTRIAQTVLADFIMLGVQKVGSFALASSKTHLFAVAIGAYLDEIEEVFNTHAVPRLFELNGWKLENLPEIRHGDIEDVDLEELGNYISKLAGAGAQLFPNEALEKYLLDVANLPSEG